MHKNILLLALTLILLCACGVDGSRFRMEGRILNMNQGELYVYSDDGTIRGVDTIRVQGGRFTYETECSRPATLMLVFPNFSEQPVFAQPGEEVDIQGDASHLRELRVEGTDDNELMTRFREQVASASPPEARRYATMLVEDHPESVVGVYLVRKYLVTTPQPDPREALRLLALMRGRQQTNAALSRMELLLKPMAAAAVGQRLPVFTAYDMRGRLVSSSDLMHGLAVICSWASWSYESTMMLRTVKTVQEKAAGRLAVVSFAMDASRHDAQRPLAGDTIRWPNVCDGQLFEGKAVQQLGLRTVPDNIVVKDGRIIARSLSAQQLQQTLEKYL